jgi:hypothetical protein
MLLSAVKLSICLLATWAQGDLTNRERTAWTRIAPSTVVIGAVDKPQTVGVLLDDSGLFIAQNDGISTDIMQGVANGHTVKLSRVAVDTATGLALLQATPWAWGDGRPAHLSEKSVSNGQQLFVVLPSGPIRAEFVRSDRVGILTISRRMFPLNELKFESPDGATAGGIVFTQQGELVGAVSATLQSPSQIQAQNAFDNGGLRAIQQAAAGNGGAGGGVRPLTNTQSFARKQAYGPGQLTTAYTVGLAVMRRVVEGFRSPSHEVQHPSIGIFCKDSFGSGALVEKVRKDGPAGTGGMQIGDIIQSIDGERIKSQIGFASTMLQKEIGQTLTVWVLRNSLQVRLTIVVGKA